jgi:hypothetical protein
MSEAVLAGIVLPVVVAVALALWIFALYRAGHPGYSRRFRGAPSGREPDRREPDTRDLDESGTDYVDFGAPPRGRRF